MTIFIPENVRFVLSELNKAGYKSFVVGGCVRDSILNRPVNDYDVTTDALPNQVESLFEKTFNTGEKYGTITVLSQNMPVEVTTMRIDGKYVDFRRPSEIRYTEDIIKDLERRDFTMNAIAYSSERGIIDPFLGVNDIQKRIIRCVNDPVLRFSEDALRILRALRFEAQLSFCIEENTEQALKLLSHTVENISAERVLSEIKRILMSDNPKVILKAIEFKTFSKYIKKSGDYDDFEAFINLQKDTDFRLSAFSLYLYIKDSVNSPSEFLRGLKASSKSIKLAEEGYIIYKNNRLDDIKEIKEILINSSSDCVCLAVSLKYLISNNEKYIDLLREIKRYRPAQLSVDGNEILKLGFSGKQVGEIKFELMKIIINNPDFNNKNDLIRYIKDKYANK